MAIHEFHPGTSGAPRQATRAVRAQASPDGTAGSCQLPARMPGRDAASGRGVGRRAAGVRGPAPARRLPGCSTLSIGGKVVRTVGQYALPRRTPSACSYPPQPAATIQLSVHTDDLGWDRLRAARATVPTTTPRCRRARPLPAHETPRSRAREVGDPQRMATAPSRQPTLNEASR
jgi:hypothetical protein